VSGQGTVKTLSFDAGGFGDFGDALSLREVAQGHEQDARLVFIFQRSFEVLGSKIRVLAEPSNNDLVVGNAGFAFHEVPLLSL